MPEEINRKITDAIFDLLLTPAPNADENLAAEGVSPDRIHCVGNAMIDSLTRAFPKIRQSDILEKMALVRDKFDLAPLHRPSAARWHRVVSANGSFHIASSTTAACATAL